MLEPSMIKVIRSVPRRKGRSNPPDLSNEFRGVILCSYPTENVLKYMKRFSTVEPPIGVFKRFYHVDEFLSNSMVGIQNRINICSGSYNLKRLYNQLMAIEGIDEDNILDFTRNVCKLTNVEMFNSRDNDILFIENKLLLPYYCESIKQKELEYYAEINANSSQLKLTDYAA